MTVTTIQFYVIGQLSEIGNINNQEKPLYHKYVIWDTSHRLCRLFISVSIFKQKLKSGNFYKIEDADVQHNEVIYNKYFATTRSIFVERGHISCLKGTEDSVKFKNLSHIFLKQIKDDLNSIANYNQKFQKQTKTILFNGIRNIFNVNNESSSHTVMVKILDLGIIQTKQKYSCVFNVEAEGKRFNIIQSPLQNPNQYRNHLNLIKKNQLVFFCNIKYFMHKNFKYFNINSKSIIIFDICKPLSKVLQSKNLIEGIAFIWPPERQIRTSYICPYIRPQVFNQLQQSYKAAAQQTNKTLFNLLASNINKATVNDSLFKFRCVLCKKYKNKVKNGCCGTLPVMGKNMWYDANIYLEWQDSNKVAFTHCKIGGIGIAVLLKYLSQYNSVVPHNSTYKEYINYYQQILQQQNFNASQENADKLAFAIDYFFETIRNDNTAVLQWLVRQKNSIRPNHNNNQYVISLCNIIKKQITQHNANNNEMDDINFEMENKTQLLNTNNTNNINNNNGNNNINNNNNYDGINNDTINDNININTDNYNNNDNINNNNYCNGNADTNNININNNMDNYSNDNNINNKNNNGVTRIITNKKRSFTQMAMAVDDSDIEIINNTDNNALSPKKAKLN